MKSVIIIGSSGMIGELVLTNCLNNHSINKVTVINRKPSTIKHPKLTEVIHSDFLNFDSLNKYLQKQDICFYCLGVYTGQVPIPEFNKITIDFTKAFATALKNESPLATMCFLSGAGADSSEKSSVLFAKSKGIAENTLINLNFYKTYIFRPGYIYPVTPRKEPDFLYKLFRMLYKPISMIYPNIGVTSVHLAEKMVHVALNGHSKIVLENKDIKS